MESPDNSDLENAGKQLCAALTNVGLGVLAAQMTVQARAAENLPQHRIHQCKFATALPLRTVATHNHRSTLRNAPLLGQLRMLRASDMPYSVHAIRN